MSDDSSPDPASPSPSGSGDEDGLSARDRSPALLGEIAVEMKFVSLEALATLLEEQKKGTSYVGIGEALVFKGLITRPQLAVLLTEQARRLGADGDRLFGQLAIDEGLISSRSIDLALAEQRKRLAQGMRSPIGMILIERELLAPSDVERILTVQTERMRREDSGKGCP